MSPSYLLFVIAACAVISSVYGDIYLQNFRGNNNRLDEESADRQNDQRLFNSENNARGGYCWGPELTFYAGSIVALEWTTQHSCGNSNTQCNLVLQYMCSSDAADADETLMIRDGLTTNKISTVTDPNDADYYNKKDATVTETSPFVYGMNEPYQNYADCAQRSRNKGLFLADQNVNEGAGAMATRQNTGGTRYGFECTEEHDYYPYWHPSPWKDIVVFADQKSQCDWYKSESQNVKGKNFCKGDTAAQKNANNQVDCAKAQGEWAMQPSWGLDAPECKEAQWSRDNHLGNGVEGHTNSYNWTLPSAKEEDCINNGNCTCVFRIRYNITVGELTGREDSKQNGASVSPVTNDPTVMFMDENYTLALDTNQVSRTFQDRSYMFRIAPRPSFVKPGAKIYNLNVRGKRGNIVQTYPATEYDFVPTFLEVTTADYVHFQWTGCDHNPQGNNGEGKTKTDRSNIVQIADMTRNYPLNATELKKANKLFKDDDLRKRMANIDQVNCLSYDDLKEQEATTGTAVDQNSQNCMVLNQAGPRFSGQLVSMNIATGQYAFMNTRNNNFSNRSQKGQISVKSAWRPWQTAVVVVGGTAVIGVGAAAGTVFYASRHPLSKVAEFVHRVPGFSKV